VHGASGSPIELKRQNKHALQQMSEKKTPMERFESPGVEKKTRALHTTGKAPRPDINNANKRDAALSLSLSFAQFFSLRDISTSCFQRANGQYAKVTGLFVSSCVLNRFGVVQCSL